MPDYQLRKSERLSSAMQLNTLFTSGRSFVAFPVRFVWMLADRDGQFPARVAFSVSKKFWKRAVDRNLLKRRMREAYRLHKDILYTIPMSQSQQILLACLYIADKIETSEEIVAGMRKGLKRISSGVSDNSQTITT